MKDSRTPEQTYADLSKKTLILYAGTHGIPKRLQTERVGALSKVIQTEETAIKVFMDEVIEHLKQGKSLDATEVAMIALYGESRDGRKPSNDKRTTMMRERNYSAGQDLFRMIVHHQDKHGDWYAISLDILASKPPVFGGTSIL